MPIFTLSPRTHNFAIAGAALFGGLAFASAATAAGGTYYHAELASPATQTRFVARDVVWACKDASCIAGQGTSRPLIMCSALAKAVGPVTSFTAGGKALDADDLARCNAVK
ncbi:CC_3452 family protein [Sphingopyxis sp. 22461]|uniref:CC_3452 family protein n=1 Tax=Sphingopyxis sp. 22461 TaxID=3453923 RepID=UPI003F825918